MGCSLEMYNPTPFMGFLSDQGDVYEVNPRVVEYLVGSGRAIIERRRFRREPRRTPPTLKTVRFQIVQSRAPAAAGITSTQLMTRGGLR
jgi:hypothetical protein